MIRSYSRGCLGTLLDWVVSKIPIPVAIMLEWRIQKVLGKGIGFGSVAHEVRTIKFFLEKQHINEPTVFDVGANVGQFASEFFKQLPGVHIHSFEPGAEAFFELSVCSHTKLHWLIYNFGFGDSMSTMPLYSEIPGSASSSLLPRNSLVNPARPQDQQEVQIRTIDDFIENDLRIIPDVIKLDVEGYEFACLKGASKYIHQIKLIKFEFGQTNIDSRVFFRDFWIYFQNHGFDLYRVTNKSPIQVHEYNETLETFLVTNYIALNRRFL